MVGPEMVVQSSIPTVRVMEPDVAREAATHARTALGREVESPVGDALPDEFEEPFRPFEIMHQVSQMIRSMFVIGMNTFWG